MPDVRGIAWLVPVLVTIQTAILIAAVPWAMKIQTSVARLEEKIAFMAPPATRLVHRTEFDTLKDRVLILEQRNP